MMTLRLAFVLILLMGCSVRHKGPGPDQLEFGSGSQAMKVLKGDQVICEGGDCPESVAAFYMHYSESNNRHRIQLCSATLLTANTILTNKHCIDPVLKEGDLCGSKVSIEVKFPQTKNKAYASYSCHKILKTSQDYFFVDKSTHKKEKRRSVPDWAIIELDREVEGRVPVQTEALVTEENPLPVSLYPVYFDKSFSPPKGVIKAVQCQRRFSDNSADIFSNDHESPLFSIEQCSSPLVQGNSGTGVFYGGGKYLLGVMATVGSAHASGTTAHCLPNFNGLEEHCIFPQDQEFIETMKVRAFLKIIYGNIRSAYPLTHAIWENVRNVDLDGFVSADQEKRVRFTLDPKWQRFSDYLKANGSENFARNYRSAFLRVLVPRLPRCIVGGAKDAEILLLSMPDWDILLNYHWEESLIPNTTGEAGTEMKSSSPPYQYNLQPVSFSVQTKEGLVTLRAMSGSLPSLMTSLEINVPVCSH
ncbi:MAG: trypsin-like serine protease [Bdellovibrionaceae bacterium]|nr:trypsin-like serine protease [Pseudobdellovibrionaceae bacterium]